MKILITEKQLDRLSRAVLKEQKYRDEITIVKTLPEDSIGNFIYIPNKPKNVDLTSNKATGRLNVTFKVSDMSGVDGNSFIKDINKKGFRDYVTLENVKKRGQGKKIYDVIEVKFPFLENPYILEPTVSSEMMEKIIENLTIIVEPEPNV